MIIPFDAYPEVIATTEKVREIILYEEPEISPEQLEVALSAARLAALQTLPRLYAARLDQTAALQESQTDSMTGLHNKRGFNSSLERAVAQALADQMSLSLVFMYFDNLKRINDTEGHQAGDDAIVRVADILRHYIQADSMQGDHGYIVSAPARFEGGDDFGVVLTNATQQHAAAWWHDLDMTFRASDVIMCTGIVSYDPMNIAAPDDIYAHAHEALLTARTQGGTYLA